MILCIGPLQNHLTTGAPGRKLPAMLQKHSEIGKPRRGGVFVDFRQICSGDFLLPALGKSER